MNGKSETKNQINGTHDNVYWKAVAVSRKEAAIAVRKEFGKSIRCDHDKELELLNKAIERYYKGLNASDRKIFAKSYFALISALHVTHVAKTCVIVSGGFSLDAFLEFRYWLVLMGKDVYETILKNPESLVDYSDAFAGRCYFGESIEEMFDMEVETDADMPEDLKLDESFLLEMKRAFPKLHQEFWGK